MRYIFIYNFEIEISGIEGLCIAKIAYLQFFVSESPPNILM